MRLLLLLLLLPGAAAQWQAPPDDRVLSGTEPIIVQAPPDGQWMLAVDDASGDKSSTIRLDVVCDEACTWIGFLDTRRLEDGAHDLYLFEGLGQQPSEVRSVQTEAAGATERPFVWPDPPNPWPRQLDGTGQTQVMVWVANLGTRARETVLSAHGKGLSASDFWDVRANEHSDEARWMLQPGQSRQLLVTLDVQKDAAAGTTLTWTAAAGGQTASWVHTFDGWQETGQRTPMPLGAFVLLAAAALRR